MSNTKPLASPERLQAVPAELSPLVSIVIAAYAGTAHDAALLDETLRTVAAQTCQDYECIVVDDGSPADLRPVVSAHHQTTLLRQANAGCAMARNTGLGVARGQFIVILDADDYLLPEALEAGLRELAAHPECGFSVGRREEMTYEGGPVPWGVPTLPNETRMHHALLAAQWYILPPSSAMFRREVVEAIGGFQDPWGADDLDFYLRVAHRFEGWCFNEPAVTRYRRYSASSSRNGARMLQSMRAVYARQWPLVQGDPAGEEAWHRGREKLTEIFRDCLAENLRDRIAAGAWRRALACIPLLARESPRRLRDELARIVMPGRRVVG